MHGADIVGIRAGNPSPLTLSGTNTWIVGRHPAYVVDPGPDLADHLEAVEAELTRRGGLGGIALTHDHIDHSEAVTALRGRHPHVPLAAARGVVDVTLTVGQTVGPLEALPLPGHAEDHLVFLVGDVALSGDAVLGEGSVFITPTPGALRHYLEGLRQLRARRPRLILPGHGPIVEDPERRIDEYLAHRNEREARLLEALRAGRRSTDELLDAAWPEVPEILRAAAAITLAAHVDKLAEEGRLPPGTERPELAF